MHGNIPIRHSYESTDLRDVIESDVMIFAYGRKKRTVDTGNHREREERV